MKRLLKLFSIISLGTIPVMSVVACGGSNPVSKNDLTKLTVLIGLNFNSTNNFSALNS